MRFLILLFLPLMLVSSCRRLPTSKTFSCDGLFGTAYQKCLKNSGNGMDALTSDATALQVGAGASSSELHGLIYNIKSKSSNNLCLAEIAGKWSWNACETYAVSQQFHLDDRVNIKYTLKNDRSKRPIPLDGTAFRIQTRASTTGFLRFQPCNEGQTPEKDNCVVDNGQETSANEIAKVLLRCLHIDANGKSSTVECSKGTYFIALPNKNGDNLALFPQFVFSSLVAMMDKSQELNTMGLASPETATGECDELTAAFGGCDSVKPLDLETIEVPKFLDYIEHFAQKTANCSSFRVLGTGAGNSLSASCPSSGGLTDDQDGNKKIVLDACETSPSAESGQCFNDSPIKDFRDHLVEVEKGPIVQVMKPTDSKLCLKASTTGTLSYETCNIAKNDNESTQFRLAKTESKANGESIMQLRPVANDLKCADIAGAKIIDCDKLVDQEVNYIFDGSSNDLRMQGNATAFYKFHQCTMASNHDKTNFYDCHYQVPERIKRWNRLSFVLGFLALAALPLAAIGAPLLVVDIAATVLSIPSYVFDGLVCTSGDPVVAKGACMGLGVSIVADVAFSDFMPSSINSSAFKNTATRTYMKNSYGTGLAKSLIYTAKKMVKSGAWRPDFAASTVDAMLLKMMKVRKYDRQQIKDLLSLVRHKPSKVGCGVIACNHPLMPFPRINEIDSYIDKSLIPAIEASKMEAPTKAAIKSLLDPKATPASIEAARKAL